MCAIECRWQLDAGDYAAGSKARMVFCNIIAQLGTDDSDRFAVAVVFGELLTNSLRHAERSVTASLLHEGDDFILDVRDDGECFDPREIPVPSADRESGRGLQIVRYFADRLEVDLHEGLCRVRAFLHLRCGAGAARSIACA